MTIEEAIKLAIEGGYGVMPKRCTFRRIEVETDRYLLYFYDNLPHQPEVFFIPLHKTFLEPTFWQSLSKSLGEYTTVCVFCLETIIIGEDTIGKNKFCDHKNSVDYRGVWLENWQKFIYTLSLGKTAEDYFTQLK